MNWYNEFPTIFHECAHAFCIFRMRTHLSHSFPFSVVQLELFLQPAGEIRAFVQILLFSLSQPVPHFQGQISELLMCQKLPRSEERRVVVVVGGG